MLVFALIAALQGAPPQAVASSTQLIRAESLLAAGKLADARTIAEHLEDREPNNSRILTLLGRIHLAWPVIGRFKAETLLLRAARLAPDNPEPLYYLGKVGLALGGDDGEQVARLGLLPLLALDPGYRDAWSLWLKLYRGDRERRGAIQALRTHAGSWKADFWCAQMLLEQGETDTAITLLQDLVRRRADDPGIRAWLARALFLAGRDVEGTAAYQAALAHAADDTGQVLWLQIRGIASDAETAQYEATVPEQRAAFFRVFWARREPDLRTPVNERFAEHFKRLAEAVEHYRLLHPNSRYFRSAIFRGYSGGAGPMPGGLEGAEQRALNAQCSARLAGYRDSTAQLGYGPRIKADTEAASPNLFDGLDDRGRVFLRQGPPTMRLIGSLADETWCYVRNGGVLRVTFVRRTGGFGASGDMVVTPLMAGEAQSAFELLSSDRFDAHDDLNFTFWPAAFRAADRNQTELLLIPDSIAGVAVLIDADGNEAARDSATRHALRLTAVPGRYLLNVDADRGGHTARYRGAIPVPDFSGEAPSVSSILLAAGTTSANRDSMIAVAPAGLVLPAETPIRVYAELYSLGRQDGVSRYQARYRFERLDRRLLRGRDPVTMFAFEREHPFESRVIESLIVDPGRLPRGHYRLNVEITDHVREAHAASATIEFFLR